jgi:hypothetical protein
MRVRAHVSSCVFMLIHVLTCDHVCVYCGTHVPSLIAGEFDPKGLLNKIFYSDVPTMKETQTDQVAHMELEKKKAAEAEELAAED